jgi:hypothetical protein
VLREECRCLISVQTAITTGDGMEVLGPMLGGHNRVGNYDDIGPCIVTTYCTRPQTEELSKEGHKCGT